MLDRRQVADRSLPVLSKVGCQLVADVDRSLPVLSKVGCQLVADDQLLNRRIRRGLVEGLALDVWGMRQRMELIDWEPVARAATERGQIAELEFC